MEKELKTFCLTDKESDLIDILRRVIWGKIEITIQSRDIKFIKKIQTKVYK